MNNIIINNFIKTLSDQKYSQSTIQSYRFALENLKKYLDNNRVELRGLNSVILGKYLDYLQENKRPQTVNSNISAMKKFFDYIYKEYKIKIQYNLTNLKVVQRKNINLINIKDVLDFFNHDLPIINDRNQLLFLMIYETGLKTKEILNLKPSNFLDDKIVYEDKDISITRCLREKVQQYIQEYNFQKNNFLFFTYANKKINFQRHLTEKSVQDLFNTYKKMKKGDNISIRDLRSSRVLFFKKELFNPEAKFNIKMIDYPENYIDYLKNIIVK